MFNNRLNIIAISKYHPRPQLHKHRHPSATIWQPPAVGKVVAGGQWQLLIWNWLQKAYGTATKTYLQLSCSLVISCSQLQFTWKTLTLQTTHQIFISQFMSQFFMQHYSSDSKWWVSADKMASSMQTMGNWGNLLTIKTITFGTKLLLATYKSMYSIQFYSVYIAPNRNNSRFI